jgi:SAM-dependent methyltransferase
MSLPFQTSPHVYDLLYEDKDYVAEAEFINRTLLDAGNPPGQILELGSGTGQHARLLAEKGYTIEGVDCSAGMVENALKLRNSQKRELQDRLNFHKGNVCDFQLGRKVDAIVSLFHVVSYQSTNAEVLAMFNNARAHLNEGGLFLFDTWYGPAVLTEPPAVRVKRVGDDLLDVKRLCEPALDVNLCRVEVYYTYLVREKPGNTVNEYQETHVMRYFFRPELEQFLEASGFRLKTDLEWLTGNPLGTETFGACFVAEAV